MLNDDIDDDALIKATLKYPVLVNRPIVCSVRGVRLSWPSECVLELLEHLPPGPLFKEDGEMIIDEQGRPVVQVTRCRRRIDPDSHQAA